MRRTLPGVLMTTSLPEFMAFRSSVQMSGRSAAMCSTRFSGAISVVPSAAIFGSSGDGTKRPPGSVVMLRMSSGLWTRMRATTSL